MKDLFVLDFLKWTRVAFEGLAVCAAFGVMAPKGALAEPASKVVLELFTSQGCSSCPPADALLGTLAQREDVIALSLPVDYWDYLGWKDTFAKAAFSDRQRHYAAARGDREVYTPQLVIGGRIGVVGSSRDQVANGIAQAKSIAAQCPIRLEAQSSASRVVISVAHLEANYRATCPGQATLFLARVQREGRVRIGRGENGGREIIYHNIVRSLEPLGGWGGEALTREVDVPKTSPEGQDFLVAFLQSGVAGPILASSVVEMTP